MSKRLCFSPRAAGSRVLMHGRRGRHPTSRRTAIVAPALRGVLCDLDGVIYASGNSTVIPGATETLRYLRERQIPWLFVTNTNTKNREGLAARLRAMGIECTAEDIVSPAKLAADWLRTHNAGPTALFVAPELTSEFEGIPLLPPTAESGAAAVVIGDMGLDWDYRELNRAFRLVMDGELRMESAHLDVRQTQCDGGNGTSPEVAQGEEGQQQQPGPVTLISLGKGRYYKDTDGYSIDVGPFTAALEFATDTKAVVLGKPDPLIFCLAAESLGLQPEEVVMIGDDVRGDVGGAQAAGLRGVLVRTGKFREHDLAVGVTPDAVLPSVAEFPAWWEAQQRPQGDQQQQDQEQQQQQQQQQEEVREPAGHSKPSALVALRA